MGQLAQLQAVFRYLLSAQSDLLAPKPRALTYKILIDLSENQKLTCLADVQF